MSKNTLYIISIFAGVVVLSIFVWQIFNLKNKVISINRPSPTSTPIPTPTPDPDRPFSVLLMGYGGAGHDGGSLTDSIILANIRPHDKNIKLVSIPRDLWVNTKVGETEAVYSKINYAFPSGGGELASKIVTEVTGQEVENFVALDFSGFIKIIDQLGGLDLKITAPFVDNFYPLAIGATDTCGKTPEEIIALESTMSGEKLAHAFTCRYETLVFNVGTTHLDGATALKYVRSRHSTQSGGDFNRSLRQKQVMLAVRDKVFSLNFITKIIPIYKTLKGHIQTDLDTSDIEKFISRGVEFSKYKVDSITLNDKNVLTISKSQNGQSILIPTSGMGNYEAVKNLLKFEPEQKMLQ